MVRYRPEELEQFLREIDGELGEPVDIIIIGGAAVAIGYGSKHATKDIDLWTNPTKPFWEAVERARKRTGLTVPVSPTPIAEPPESFEDRVQRYLLEGTSRLRIWLPERHDLALMKAARGEAPDLDAIVDIHRHEPLEIETLIQRFPEMMPIGPASRFRLKFLAMIAVVFGESAADEVEKRGCQYDRQNCS